jgi:hypothetical protein
MPKCYIHPLLDYVSLHWTNIPRELQDLQHLLPSFFLPNYLYFEAWKVLLLPWRASFLTRHTDGEIERDYTKSTNYPVCGIKGL